MYVAALAAAATSPDSRASQAGDPEWEVALGTGAINVSSAWKGADDQIELVPFIDIRKGNWHFNGDDLVGYHTQIGDSLSASIGLGFRSDGYDSGNLSFNKVKKHRVFDGYRAPDTETIFNYNIRYGWLSLGGSHDISGKSDAYSANLSAEVPIYQAGYRLSINAIASVDWYDDSYVNYYYGISGKQIDDSVGRIGYHAGAATNLEVGISVSYLINDRWSVMGIMSRTKLDDSIVDSPLIDSDYVDSAGFIFVRRF